MAGLDVSNVSVGGVSDATTTPVIVSRRGSTFRPVTSTYRWSVSSQDTAVFRVVRVLEREGSGLVHAMAALGDMQRALATNGGVRPAVDEAELASVEIALAKDALHRLDLRLSRLLRRARLGRIESVLGRRRALEVEVEAIGLGYLPQDAVDSLDAARYLEDNEEYWPFEGDDWPDEYVGSEVK